MKPIKLFFGCLLLLINSTVGQTWDWTNQSYSTSASEHGLGIDNADNNYVLIENIDGTVTLDSLNITSVFNDFIISKSDSEGVFKKAFLSSTLISQSGYHYIKNMNVSPNGTIVLTGRLEDPLIIAQDTFVPTANGSEYGFIVVLDSSLNYLWSKCDCNNSRYNITDVAFNSDNEIIFSGTFRDSLIFNSDTLIANSSSNGVLVKYNILGQYVKSKVFSDSLGFAEISHVEINKITDEVVISGLYTNALVLDSITLHTNSITDNEFIAFLDSSWNTVWAKDYLYDYFGMYYRPDLTLSPNGNILIAGSFGPDSLFLMDTVLNCVGYKDIFMISFDRLGNKNWLKKEGGIHEDVLHDIKTDQNNNVVITGEFPGSIYLGISNIFACGTSGLFIGQYDTDGNFLYSYSNDGCGATSANHIAVNSNNDFVFSGSFTDSLIINSDSLISSGNQNVFIAKLNGGSFTEINNLETLNEFNLYPNPIDENFSLEFSADYKAKKLLTIVNLRGDVVYQENLNNSNLVNIKLDKHLSPGIYIVTLINDNKTISKKLIVN